MNIYAQLDSQIQIDLDKYLQMFFSMLGREEFQCLFFNHLEDVYQNNISADKRVSVLHRDNYSFFLDNLNLESFLSVYQEPIENECYPIILAEDNVYIVKNNRPIVLGPNILKEEVDMFNKDIRYIASYYPKEECTKHWIPFFNYFKECEHPFNEQDNEKLYADFIVTKKLGEASDFEGCQAFMAFQCDDHTTIHHFIDRFTVFTNLI